MNLCGRLETILRSKRAEIARAKRKMPLAAMRNTLSARPQPARDFSRALRAAAPIGLIAEIKRASPALGEIKMDIDIEARARLYAGSGACAVSVLTDKHFAGELAFLPRVKAAVSVPVLRKDFIIDEYQIYESRYFGADAVLLIAAILDDARLTRFLRLARELDMRCLLEVHTKEEMERALRTPAEIIGVNARDLRTFKVDAGKIAELAPLAPADRLVVAESGITGRADVERARQAGAKAVLVGTVLTRADNPVEKIREIVL